MVSGFRIVIYISVMFVLSIRSLLAYEVSAEIDRQPIFLDETVNLIVTASGSDNPGNVEPELTPLRESFEIRSQSVQTRINVMNGQQQIEQKWVIELRPKRLGISEIPAITVGNKQTSPIAFEVKEFKGNILKPGADIFLETEMVPKNPYVQSEAIFTTRLFAAVSIPQGEITSPIMPFSSASV